MSKAFTRESDNDSDEPLLTRPALPPGVKNYMTPRGAENFREELKRLTEIERPSLASQSQSVNSSAELRKLDQRIRLLEESLRTAEIVPAPADRDRVRFGAIVQVRHATHAQSTFRIVGIDEIDLDRHWISWRSPLAQALLGRRVGERVRFQSPEGPDELSILAIAYDEDKNERS
ncbi:MAG: GreA/GreB family elongation factor [Verrucomicrobiota bacterium]